MSVVRNALKTLPKLPSPELWPSMFKVSRARGNQRVSVVSGQVAEKAVKTIGILDNPNRNIIEIYPGPGQLTRSMALAGAKKIVTVENGESFRKSLKTLEDESNGVIQNINLNLFIDPLDEVLKPGHNAFPDLSPQSWENIHSDLMVVGTVPNSTIGEKILVELLIASMERRSIFQMGRVEMYMFCYKDAVKRMMSKPSSSARNRVALLVEAAAEVTSVMQPGSYNFYPPLEYELLRLVPHEKPKLESSYEIFDFCLRSLFTNKSHSLTQVIKLLGPGADILLGRLSFDPNIKIKDMTLEQLNEVALKFEQWPLRPTELYDNMIMYKDKRKRN